MLSDNIRKRIAAMNRRRLRHTSSESGEPNRGGAPVLESGPTEATDAEDLHVFAGPSDARLTAALEEVTEGAEIRSELGCFLLIERGIGDLFSTDGGAFCERYAGAFPNLGGAQAHVPENFHLLSDMSPEDVLYVDIETTGLSAGTPLFLVGALCFAGGDLVAHQLLARDYTEEAALLDHFRGLMSATKALITFNGKSYDLPYIRDRSLFHGVPFQLDHVHVDMLHEGRRLWRDRLPNCKLQTLERYLCKRVRHGDIPGQEIPDAYHRFVQTGNAVQIRDILHHNALDLVTMAELLVIISEGRDL